MEENNRKGPGIFYAVVGVATLVVAIIGATFAYFSATVENTKDVKGTTASSADLALTVQRVSDDATATNMIPMKDDLLQSGVTGTGGKQCVDKNGNTACQIYKITIANGGNIAVNVKGTLNLSGGGATNMKWQLLDNQTTVGTGGTQVSQGTDGVIVANQALTAKDAATPSAEFYVVVWLHDTGEPQDTPDAGKSFTGTVTFNGVNVDGTVSTGGVTATFSS